MSVPLSVRQKFVAISTLLLTAGILHKTILSWDFGERRYYSKVTDIHFIGDLTARQIIGFSVADGDQDNQDLMAYGTSSRYNDIITPGSLASRGQDIFCGLAIPILLFGAATCISLMQEPKKKKKRRSIPPRSSTGNIPNQVLPDTYQPDVQSDLDVLLLTDAEMAADDLPPKKPVPTRAPRVEWTCPKCGRRYAVPKGHKPTICDKCSQE